MYICRYVKILLSPISRHLLLKNRTTNIKMKAKGSRYRPGVAQRVGRDIYIYMYSSMTGALEGGEWSAVRPGRTLPPG